MALPAPDESRRLDVQQRQRRVPQVPARLDGATFPQARPRQPEHEDQAVTDLRDQLADFDAAARQRRTP
jgi:hypothetical protein